jgi:hypothetical protein
LRCSRATFSFSAAIRNDKNSVREAGGLKQKANKQSSVKEAGGLKQKANKQSSVKEAGELKQKKKRTSSVTLERGDLAGKIFNGGFRKGGCTEKLISIIKRNPARKKPEGKS